MWEPPIIREPSAVSRNEGLAQILENLAYQVRDCYLYPEMKSIEKAYESFDTTFAARSGVVDFNLKFRLHENRAPDGNFFPLIPEEG